MIRKRRNANSRSHNCQIKNMSRLLRSQVTNHEESVFFFCLRCLNHFLDEEKLRNHEVFCSNNEEMRIEIERGTGIPEGEGRAGIWFKNHNRMIKVPFVVFTDLESIVKPISDLREPSDGKRFHKSISGACALWIFLQDRVALTRFDDKIWSRDAVVFSITQKEDERRCKSWLRCRSRQRKFHEEFDFAKKMIFPCKNRKEFEKAENCWICGLFTEQRRSHCMISNREGLGTSL